MGAVGAGTGGADLKADDADEDTGMKDDDPGGEDRRRTSDADNAKGGLGGANDAGDARNGMEDDDKHDEVLGDAMNAGNADDAGNVVLGGAGVAGDAQEAMNGPGMEDGVMRDTGDAGRVVLGGAGAAGDAGKAKNGPSMEDGVREDAGEGTGVLGDHSPVRRKLLGGRYNLEEGKVRCQCIRRKWRFCGLVKGLADGRVTPWLLRSRTLKEVMSENEASKADDDDDDQERVCDDDPGDGDGVVGSHESEGEEQSLGVQKVQFESAENVPHIGDDGQCGDDERMSVHDDEEGQNPDGDDGDDGVSQANDDDGQSLGEHQPRSATNNALSATSTLASKQQTHSKMKQSSLQHFGFSTNLNPSLQNSHKRARKGTEASLGKRQMFLNMNLELTY